MPRGTKHDRNKRYQAIINEMSAEPVSIEHLKHHVKMSRSTVEKDLKHLFDSFPEQVKKCSLPSNDSIARVGYQWIGQEPCWASDDDHWISSEEMIALTAAKGLLHAHQVQSESKTSMARAISNMMERSNIQSDDISFLEGRVFEIPTHGIEPCDPQQLAVCMKAIMCGWSMSFTYQSKRLHEERKGAKSRHVKPALLRLIDSEWYVIVYTYEIRTFKVARIVNAEIRKDDPKDLDPSITFQDIKVQVSSAFKATSTEKEVIVRIECHRDLLLDLKDRKWGKNTKIKNEEREWFELSFKTSGIMACEQWILSHGGKMRVLEPQPLRDSVLNKLLTAVKVYQS